MKDGLPSDNGAARTFSFNARGVARARLRAHSQTSLPHHGCGSNTLLLTTGDLGSSTARLDCALTHRWATNTGPQQATDWRALRVGQKRMEEDRAIHSSWGDPRYSTSASPCRRCSLGRQRSHVAFFFFSHCGALMRQLGRSIRRVGSILHMPWKEVQRTLRKLEHPLQATPSTADWDPQAAPQSYDKTETIQHSLFLQICYISFHWKGKFTLNQMSFFWSILFNAKFTSGLKKSSVLIHNNAAIFRL